MKNVFCLFIFIVMGFTGFSQNILDSMNPLFKGKIDGDLIRKHYAAVGSPSFTKSRGAVINGKQENEIKLIAFHSNNLFYQNSLIAAKKLPEIINFGSDRLPFYKMSPDTTMDSYLRQHLFATPLFDSLGIIVTASGINKENAHEYEFRVMENRTREIVSWRPITLFCESYTQRNYPDGSEETETAYLGEFKTTFGNGLTIEIRKKESKTFLVSISFLWVNRAPSVLGTFSNNNMPEFLSVFKQQWKHDFFALAGGTYYGDIESPPVDSLLVTKKIFTSSENSIVFYLNDKVKSKDIIEYNLVTGNKSSGWKSNDFDFNLIWLKNLAPGNYNLQMRYSLQRHNISNYEFRIEAAWHQTLAFKIIAGIFIMVLISFIIILFISARQKQKLRQEQLQNQQTQTELKSIRSQFNPHFVFNALNSIQGLITKDDMEGANKYLTEFSILLRDSLKESSKESTSLFTEIKMLDSYLRLEQLRFGFTYTIDTDSTIDKNAVEVPALLLQPLIENAVKHGIASLYEKGKLMIYFKRSFSDMHVEISDNGNGFNPNDTTSGYGMKLTRDRIALLNKLLKEQSIELSINSTGVGTNVHLLFKNLLL